MKPSSIIPQKILGFKSNTSTSEITPCDAILYAMGITFLNNQSDLELSFLNQAKKNFKIFPTFATCVNNVDALSPLITCTGVPEFNPFMILHAQQKLTMNRPMQPGMKLETSGQIVNVQDKGKITVFTIKFESRSKGQIIFTNQMSLIIRGMGGTTHKGTPGPTFAKKQPIKTIQISTYLNQALVYRLSGDRNPLHVDSSTAAVQNFQKPILHGLATYGTVCKALVIQLVGGDSNRLKVYHGRFISHVFPGERLQVSYWREDKGFGFAAKTKQRSKDVIVGYIQFDDKETTKL